MDFLVFSSSKSRPARNFHLVNSQVLKIRCCEMMKQFHNRETMRGFQILGVCLACCALASSMEMEGALRSDQPHGRELVIHLIPILLSAAHGAAAHSIASASHIIAQSATAAKLKFSASEVKIKLEDEVKELTYEQVCKELIEYAVESSENANTALQLLREIYGDGAAGLTVEVFANGNLECILETNCIGGDNFVLLESGASKLVRHLAVGDMVQTSVSIYEPILMLPSHKHVNRDSVVATFLRLVTNSGSEIVLSAGHFLPVVGKGLLPAASVQVGDLVLDASGNSSVVIRVTTQIVKGVYFPLTPSCKLVVEGVQVSCATESSWTPYAIELTLVPFYLVQRIVPAAMYELIHNICMFVVKAVCESQVTLIALPFAGLVSILPRAHKNA